MGQPWQPLSFTLLLQFKQKFGRSPDKGPHCAGAGACAVTGGQDYEGISNLRRCRMRVGVRNARVGAGHFCTGGTNRADTSDRACRTDR